MIFKSIRGFVLFLFSACALCWGQVSIAASSEFRPAIEEIRKAFQDQTGIPTRASYGSSGAMVQRAKAPGTDIFLASDKNWADSLAAGPRADDQPVVLASQPVCAWIRGSVIEPSADLSHLGELSPGSIVLSDTLLSPDGSAVVKALHNLPNWPSLRARLVMLADPGVVVDSLAAHRAQAIVAAASDSAGAKDSAHKADAKAPDTLAKKHPAPAKKAPVLANGFLPQPLLWNNTLAGSGRWVPIDPSVVAPLRPTVLRLKSVNGPRTDAAKAFLAFLQAPKARSILRNNGFLPAP